jgi:hypothetical protein
MTGMSEELAVALSWAACGVSVGAGLMAVAGMMLWQALASKALARPGLPEMDYQVEAVPPGIESDYRRLNPKAVAFPEFAAAVLANPDYAPWHEQVRADARRYAARFAGLVTFVKVRCLP